MSCADRAKLRAAGSSYLEDAAVTPVGSCRYEVMVNDVRDFANDPELEKKAEATVDAVMVDWMEEHLFEGKHTI